MIEFKIALSTNLKSMTMKNKLIFTAVLLCNFQLFYAQETKTDTTKVVTKTTITTVTTIKDTVRVDSKVNPKIATAAEKKALKNESKALQDKMRLEKKALKEAKETENEKKDFEKKTKSVQPAPR